MVSILVHTVQVIGIAVPFIGCVSLLRKVRSRTSIYLKLPEVFGQNPYMAEIYPQEESRTALEVFQVYEGSGEYFDLSVKPIFRERFMLGEGKEDTTHAKGYFITDRCWMPDLLFQMSAEVYRSVGEASGHQSG